VADETGLNKYSKNCFTNPLFFLFAEIHTNACVFNKILTDKIRPLLGQVLTIPTCMDMTWYDKYNDINHYKKGLFKNQN
jgi:hypothetical protein